MKRPMAALGRFLLRVFPEDFRERFGDDIAHHFKARSDDIYAQKGPRAVLRFWFTSFVDIARTAAAERREERAMRKASLEGGLFSDVGPDIRFALRALRRTPGFTLVVLCTLALGIGATTAMLGILARAIGLMKDQSSMKVGSGGHPRCRRASIAFDNP